ncbi:MAG: transposase, partial [Rhodopirellula sp. JB055]|uniref:transposase n=1 Tax=Rhodopirellula sp. JB055 TaxID=3342846 RepID=UPI00370A0A48
IVPEVAPKLKAFLCQTGLKPLAQMMMLRIVLTFIMHRGRMSCSAAAGAIAAEPIHRGELTRFLARPRWQKHDFNEPLMRMLLAKEKKRGKFLFLIDATLVSQSGKKTQNTFSTGNRTRRKIKKGFRYNNKKVVRKNVHSFTFGLLITPSGIRIPMQIPHRTKEYCAEHGIVHMTTAEAAAEMIRTLPLDDDAEVVVLGDTAYEAKVVQEACDEKGYTWVFPANPERVYEGPTGERPQLRSRLKDWTSLSLKTIRLRAFTGKYADYRRLSKWRVGPKIKPRVYYAHQERRKVRSVGDVQIVFSTMKPNLEKATPDDVKILLTNAVWLSVTEVLELYSVRWQIELFFKELKSTLGFSQYSFIDFRAVEAWVNLAITTVLYLEHERITHMLDRRLSKDRQQWWQRQRLHGLCHAVRQANERDQLKYIEKRIKTSGGLKKLQRLLAASIPQEYRVAA